MCLAIFKPKNSLVSKEHLIAGFASNRSGCGFMYHDNGKLHIFKKLVSFAEFYEAYLQIEKDHDVAIHFRAATHGPRNDANCHPFSMCDGNFGMIHNGVFNVPLKNRNLSDTGNFCEMVLEPAIKDGSYQNKGVHKYWSSKESYILENDNRWGWGSVVLMGADGKVIIYNESSGVWDKNVWYSNRCYRHGGWLVKDESELVAYPPHNGYSYENFWD